METHICPTCSQPCSFKHGIMCTIQGCVKDQNNNSDDFVKTMMDLFGNKSPYSQNSNNTNPTVK